jgi:hypothetical protein
MAGTDSLIDKAFSHYRTLEKLGRGADGWGSTERQQACRLTAIGACCFNSVATHFLYYTNRAFSINRLIFYCEIAE